MVGWARFRVNRGDGLWLSGGRAWVAQWEDATSVARCAAARCSNRSRGPAPPWLARPDPTITMYCTHRGPCSEDPADVKRGRRGAWLP